MILKNLIILVPACIGILAGSVFAADPCSSGQQDTWYVPILAEYPT
jgi:hypothetical protein